MEEEADAERSPERAPVSEGSGELIPICEMIERIVRRAGRIAAAMLGLPD